MKRHRRMVIRLTITAFALLAPWHAAAQGLSLEPNGLFFTAMSTWTYNGFTTDSEGAPVQGSDVSPLRFTFGGGVVLALPGQSRVEPQLWVRRQEYIALRQYDKTVPTQIETGATPGDIADTVALALEVPWLWRTPWFSQGPWELSAGGGLALVFRIPVRGIDGTDGGPVGQYWIAGRFVYPFVATVLDYRMTPNLHVGAGISWYVPVYNLWSESPPGVPFLDETMMRAGLRIRLIPE